MEKTAFQGRKLGEVVTVWENMLKDKDLTIVLGLSGSMSTAGQWKIINWLIEKRFIDVIVSTGANVSEDIIEAMGFKRKDVYICNVLKCRPPENRNPLPSEILVCQEYLRQQLEMIKPQIICCMGRFACQALLNQDLPIGKLRGKFQDYCGIKVMPTFHPAYLLRNPRDKKLVWEDMQKIMKELKR